MTTHQALAVRMAEWLTAASSPPPDFAPDGLQFPAYYRRLVEHEALHRAATTDAVRRLIATNSMPDTTDKWRRYFLRLRLQAALDFLAQASCQPPDSPDPLWRLAPRTDFHTACETLLSPLWCSYRCDHWLRAVAVATYFHLPLFGASPATD